MALGAVALAAVAAVAILVPLVDQTSTDEPSAVITESTIRVASAPPVPTSTQPAVATTTTSPAVAPSAPPTVAPTVANTEPPPPPPTTVPRVMVDVTDANGAFVVQLPREFQTNVQPVTLGGVGLNNVSGATDIDRYLAGDFSVVGATVLAGPTAQVGSAGSVLARFDPGDACTLSDFETEVATTQGQAVLLSYDDCGDGQYSMILLAVEVIGLQQTVFVGVQDIEPSWGDARDLAIGILESFHPV